MNMEKPQENSGKKRVGPLVGMALGAAAVVGAGAAYEGTRTHASDIQVESNESGQRQVHIMKGEHKAGERFVKEGQGFVCNGEHLLMIDESGQAMSQAYDSFIKLENGTWIGQTGDVKQILNEKGLPLIPKVFDTVASTDFGFIATFDGEEYKIDKSGQPIGWSIPSRRPGDGAQVPPLTELPPEFLNREVL